MISQVKSVKLMKEHRLSMHCIYILSSIFLIFVWSFFIAPQFKKIPDNFSYKARLLSIDNFYDAKTKKFEGDHISKAVFSYDVLSAESTYLVIMNTFKVTKISGTPIFSVSREYYIDPAEAKHVNIPGKNPRAGYLFAPQYSMGQPFIYWHVNYNAPALMKFVKKEDLYGLKVYEYSANYHADQTSNLVHLPDVPTKRGIRAFIELRLWVEPISGLLVKYVDNTTAYYYDQKTGELIEPWNKFSNRYTERSIVQKVNQAKHLKWKYLWIDFGVPTLIVLVTILLIFYPYISNFYSRASAKAQSNLARHKHLIHVLILILILLAAGLSTFYYFLRCKKTSEIYKVGISQWNNNLESLSAVQGFKDGLAEFGFYEGKNVEFIIRNPNSKFENQLSIIQQFVHDKLDLIFTLSTPGTLIAKGVTSKIPIIFSDVSFPEESGIINKSTNKSNLAGTINYITPAEQFYFLERIFPNIKTLGFLHFKGDPDSEILYKEFKLLLNKRNIEVIDIAAIDVEDMQRQLNFEWNKSKFSALYIACDTLIRDKGYKIAAEFTTVNKIPSFSCDKSSVINGVLVGYFADLYALGKASGIKAAIVLKGGEPSWLKSELPRKGYLIINLITAKLLGLSIPKDEIDQADSIIHTQGEQ